MADKQEHIKQLQEAIQQLHRCKASHRRTVSVHERLSDRTVWAGEVEVFWLTGHPSAKRCYAWFYRQGMDKGREQIVAMLEIPPIIGPATAVRAAVAAREKGKL